MVFTSKCELSVSPGTTNATNTHELSGTISAATRELSGTLVSSSAASIKELDGSKGDKSLHRAGEYIRLQDCEDQTFIANAYKYCQACLGGSWAKCSADKFSVQYLIGGLTNYLYLCSLGDDVPTGELEPRKVLIRIYGDIVDQKRRFYEGIIFNLLSERGFGPKSLGVFYSGRIEEFIPQRTLSRKEMAYPRISKLIANRLGQFHCMKLPLNKEPTYLWENIEKFIGMCSGIQFTEPAVLTAYENIKTNLNFEIEYRWLKSVVLELNAPVVFCHNDLHGSNILYNENHKNAEITLIDFDYSCYNYRGYDIGNHFCQWIYEYNTHHDGNNADGFILYKDDYPSRKEQILFASEYLATLSQIKENGENNGFDSHRRISDICVSDVNSLLHEVDVFALVALFYWGLWSIIQQEASKISFAYMKYASTCFDEYFKRKKQLGYCGVRALEGGELSSTTEDICRKIKSNK